MNTIINKQMQSLSIAEMQVIKGGKWVTHIKPGQECRRVNVGQGYCEILELFTETWKENTRTGEWKYGGRDPYNG